MTAVLTGDDHLVVHHDEPELSSRQKNLILTAMCVALIAVMAAVSGLNSAQMKISESLGASTGDFLWIANAYTLALAALLMPVGAIGDRWSRRKVLLLGLTVYLVSNVVGAFAGSVAMLIGARAIAGVGAAMIMPVTLSVITSTFHGDERQRAIGIWSGFAGAGAIFGMFISSLIVDNASWRWVFIMPIALAVIAFALSARLVPDGADHHGGRFDYVGSLLSAVAVGGLVFGIHEGPEKGWTAPITLIPLVVGAVAAVAFVLYERQHENPLLKVEVFKNRMLSAGTGLLFLIFIVMMGMFLVITQFLMGVLGWGAVKATAGMLPMAFAMMPLSAVAPLIAKKTGTRALFMIGFSMAAGGLALVASMVSVDGGYLSILPGLMVVGAGLGLSMTPGTAAITGSLPPEDQGVASALNDSVREIGASVGIALMGSVLSAAYTSGVGDAASQLPGEVAHHVEEGIFGARAVSEQMIAGANGDPQMAGLGEQLLHTAQQAFVDGWSKTMWISAGIAAVAAIGAAVLAPTKSREAEFRVDLD